VLEPALRSRTRLLIERGAPAGLGWWACWSLAETARFSTLADNASGGHYLSQAAGLPAPVRA
jgi:hypothetical protein